MEGDWKGNIIVVAVGDCLIAGQLNHFSITPVADDLREKASMFSIGN